MAWSNVRVLKTGLALFVWWVGSGATSLFAVTQIAGTIQETSGTRSVQETVPGSGQRHVPVKGPEERTGQRSEMPNPIQEVEKMLLPYKMSLLSRAAETAVPPALMGQISAQVAAIAWKSLAAGLPPDQAVGAAKAFGEAALSSFRKNKQTFSLITGQQVGTDAAPPLGALGAIEIRAQRKQEQ